MKARILIAAAKSGEVIYARTETAEYYMLIMTQQVANVYRRPIGYEFCKFLGRRGLGAELVEREGFTMYDGNNDPLAAIIPLEIGKKDLSSIPPQLKQKEMF